MLRLFKISFLLIILFAFEQKAIAQCGALISTYPYSENFEAGPSWTSGGTNSDWAWGTPAHAIINTAGGGTKSWMVGGLNGAFYNYSELSWLMSPCFDFTTLNYPWISFKIFWEDEWKYDGMVLQYSLNGGTTWTNVGANGDPVDCLNAHWYNYNNITWLTSAVPKHGWTGRTGATAGACQGGNGSLGWITAKHCMSALAGQPSVRFRFLFGAGTNCNNYDGIAIDDIFIDNAPPNVPGFTSACAGANTINFTNTSTLCPTGYLWDFGDGTTSLVQSPSHTYAAAGTYTVMLTSSGPCNASGSVIIPVSVLGATTTVTNISCNGGNTGTATVIPVGNAGPFTYVWTPGGQTTATATGLAIGTYTVSVSAAGSCATTATATITQAAALSATTTVTPVSCFGGSNGTTTVSTTGGAMPYTYLWTGGSTAATDTGLGAGTYTVTITDFNGCTTTATSILTQPAAALSVSSTSTNVSCFGESNGTASATATGGTPPYTYSWTPSGGTIPAPSGLVAGVYTVTVTDANLCASSSASAITQPLTALTATATVTTAICMMNNGTATVIATGGTLPYTYSWSPAGGLAATATALPPGAYSCTISDAHSCSYTVSPTIADTGNIEVAIISTPVSVYGQSDGTAIATVTGGTGNYNYIWSNGAASAGLTALAPGSYCVNATDANGCSDSTCVDITAPPSDFNFYAPNAFTPNENGHNDVFLPKGTGWDNSTFEMWIYDRWGNTVFYTKDAFRGWDGSMNTVGDIVQLDVYVWKVKLLEIAGQQHSFIGSVTILQ